MQKIIPLSKIRFCRKALELTQQICADHIGVSTTTFKGYEKNGDLWSSQLIKLMELFEKTAKDKGINLDALFCQ